MFWQRLLKQQITHLFAQFFIKLAAPKTQLSLEKVFFRVEQI
jgi:hypothetical protein